MKKNFATISPASVQELAFLLPHFRAYQEHYSQLTAASEEKTRAFLERHLSDPNRGFVLLARVNSDVVGFAIVYLTASGLIAEDIAHLGDLYVAPSARRRGVATELFTAVKAESAARKIKLVRWLSLAGNVTANQWYESLGKKAGEFLLFLSESEASERSEAPE